MYLPRVLQRLLPLIAALCAAVAPVAAKAPPDRLPITRVRDLHYGDVLFYFYQDENFEAITRLNAYEQWQRLPHHSAEAQLLLGGLYLQLGLHNEAGARFEKLLTPDIPAGVRNRAWFYLGVVWYARGYLDKAEQSLRKVQGTLAPELEAEKVHLLANVLMRQGRFDEAVQILNGWRGSPDWVAYAQFNLGAAFVRKGLLSEADRFLTAVGTLDTQRSELLALKDRANLALGFAYLQANDAAKAKPVLERVRLSGPFSNKALLGLGWADAALGQFRDALRPWLELHNRNLLDAAVQESFLAVPYAYGKLNANAQSAEAYESAIRSFDDETRNLDDAIGKLHSGHMLDDMLQNEEQSGRYGWFWQLKSVPDAPQSRYLYTVLAGHDFQEGLKSYRDLAFMGRTLTRWTDSMDAYADMIETREKAYGERLPRADALLASGAADKLQKQRELLESRLNAVEAGGDVAALGTADERDQWARVRRVEDALATAPQSAELAALKDKTRLIKGVLLWRLTEAYKARLYQEHRSFRDLDLTLREMQNRWVRVERARKSAPSNTGDFAQRLAALKTRLDALRVRLDETRAKQNELLERLAVAELEGQKDRLATYQIQARYALASIYDRAANADVKPAATPAPAPRGEAAEEPPAAEPSAEPAPQPDPQPTPPAKAQP
jgi:hypothetical protein